MTTEQVGLKILIAQLQCTLKDLIEGVMAVPLLDTAAATQYRRMQQCRSICGHCTMLVLLSQYVKTASTQAITVLRHSARVITLQAVDIDSVHCCARYRHSVAPHSLQYCTL
jgi:hypothetical protein